MDNISFLSIFSAGVLALKFVIILRCSLKNASQWLLYYFCGFFWMNLVEASGFAYFNTHPENVFPVFISYYIAIVTVSFSALALSLDIDDRLTTGNTKLIVTIWGFCCLCILTPGLAIDDVKFIGYTYTRVPGPIYFIAPVSVVGSLGLALFISFKLLLYSNDDKTRCRAKVFLYSLLPIFLVSAAVAVLMHLDAPVNGIVTLSVATLGSMTYLFWQGQKINIFGIESKNEGGTKKSKQDECAPEKDSGKVALDDALEEALRCENGIDQSRMIIDFVLVERQIAECGGDKKEAAERLGRHLSAIYRIRKDYHKYLEQKSRLEKNELENNGSISIKE